MYGHVQDILAEKGSAVFMVDPDKSVKAAVEEMNAKGVGALLVVEEGRPVGIFTERDVLRRIVDAGIDPVSTPVRDVMTADLTTVAPETPVRSAMQLMTEGHCRHLPVVWDGELKGLVSIGDIMRRVSLRLEADLRQMSDYISGRRE